MTLARSLAAGLLVALSLASPSAQQSAGPGPGPDVYSRLHWRTIGPEGNRFSAAAGIPGDPYTYYVGSASGGIWKTTDGGVNWTAIFDDQPVQSIGALAVAPSDPNVIWAGTGEGKIRSHISLGQGVYRSVDAGKTWTLLGLEQTGRIPRLVVHPKDPDTALVCALGPSYGPQKERGIYRTTDGGKTWSQTLFVDENTGCSDIAMDPKNPRVLFAGMWTLEIHTWGRNSGGPGSGLFTSRDGGVTWTRLRGNGLPTRNVGKVAVAISASNPNRVYALIETGDGVPINGETTDRGQLWRSEDGGSNWQVVSFDHNAMGRAHYYGRMAVAPDDPDEAYFLTASFSKSIDGGKTIVVTQRAEAPGGDHHDIWIDPTNANRQIVAHDQGLSITVNRGRTWYRQRLKNAQIYHVTVDNEVPYNVLGNKQDEPTYRGPSNSRLQGGFGGDPGIPRAMWRAVCGGESGWATPDPTDSNIVWSTASGSGMVGGIVTRLEVNRGQCRNVEVWPDQSNGPAEGVKYRFVWDAPLIDLAARSQHHLRRQPAHPPDDEWRSDWEVISPDLTLNDKSKMGSSGGLTPDNIGVEYAGVVYGIAESPPGQGAHLGRHQRRPRAADTRQRQDVDERHEESAESAAVGIGAQHRAVALRRWDGVSDGGLPSGERPRSVHLPDDRLRGDVEADHDRHPEEHAELRQGHLRGSGAARDALRRGRERHLRELRCRRSLAAAADGSAARAGLRDRRAGNVQRPGHFHLRPRLLHPRRHHAAARDDARGPQR